MERAERLKIENATADAMALTAAKYSKGSERPSRSDKPCPHCLEKKGKEFFHYPDQCYLLHPEQRPKGNGRGRNGKHQFVKGATAEVEEAVEYGAWTAVVSLPSDNSHLAHSASAPGTTTLTLKVDSGASGVDCFLTPAHTVGLHSVRHVDVPISQLGKDSVSATVQGLIGNIQGKPLQALSGDGITASLLSVHGLNNRNVGVYFSGNGTGNRCLFIDESAVSSIDNVVNNALVVHEGYLAGKEYYVDITVANTAPIQVAHASVSALPSSQPVSHRSSVNVDKLSTSEAIKLLHCRANHRSPEQLYELVQSHSEGGPVPKDVPLSVYQEVLRCCDVCPLAKMKGRPHARSAQPTVKRATRPFEFLHMDVKNMTVPSYANKRCINTVVDEYTHDINALVQQYKSEVPVTLAQFNRDVVRPIGAKITDIKLDRGGENTSHDMRELASRAHFRMHFTNKSDSKANGTAERANQALGNDIRAARIGSNGTLSAKSWAELAKAVALINHFLPTSANPDKKSPQEMFNSYSRRSNTKPDISFMRILGSPAFAHVSPKDRRSDDDKAVEGVLVGYGHTYPGDPVTFYRIKEKGSNRIIETDDCDIHETIPGFGKLVSEIRPASSVDATVPLPSAPPPTPSGHEQQQPPMPEQPVRPPATAEFIDRDRVQPPPPATHLHVPTRLASFVDPALLRHADSVGDSPFSATTQGESSTGRAQAVESSASGQGESSASRTRQQPQPAAARRSTRTAGVGSLQSSRGPSAHFAKVVVPFCEANGFGTAVSHAAKALVEKKSYAETLNTPGAARGMLRELVNLMEGNKVQVVERPPGVKPITSTWAHKSQKDWKLEHDGKQPDDVDELRSRMCPRGYEQVPGESYNPDSIEAPTPHHETVRLFHSLSVNRDQYVTLIDEKSAFMETPLDDGDEVYMEFPDGMSDPTGKHCLKMLNSINGIKQAANNYYRRSRTFLLSEGFQVSKKDPCYFFKWVNKVYFQILVWVDDSRIACDCPELAEEFATKFLSTHKGTRSDGSDYLGTEIDYNRAAGTLTISVKKKVQSLLQQFGMQDCRPVSTPAVPHTQLTKPTGDNPPDSTFDYVSAVYTMYWIALIGKPEILFAVRDMSQYTHDFDQSHIIAAKHTMRYLAGQLDNHLTLHRGTSGYIRSRVYADADFAGCPEESLTPMRSTSGILVYLVGIGMILPVCKGQPTIARSTAEAEYRSSGLASTIVIGIDEFLAEIGFPQDGPTMIHQDNMACIKMTKSLLCGSKSRHIKIEHHFIRELVANNQIILVACPTSQMVADLFTKNLAKPQFEYLRDILYYRL